MKIRISEDMRAHVAISGEIPGDTETCMTHIMHITDTDPVNRTTNRQREKANNGATDVSIHLNPREAEVFLALLKALKTQAIRADEAAVAVANYALEHLSVPHGMNPQKALQEVMDYITSHRIGETTARYVDLKMRGCAYGNDRSAN